jgi:hypothetical protein
MLRCEESKSDLGGREGGGAGPRCTAGSSLLSAVVRTEVRPAPGSPQELQTGSGAVGIRWFGLPGGST